MSQASPQNSVANNYTEPNHQVLLNFGDLSAILGAVEKSRLNKSNAIILKISIERYYRALMNLQDQGIKSSKINLDRELKKIDEKMVSPD